MAADGHVFTDSEKIETGLPRLLCSSDDAFLLPIFKTAILTPGVSPTITDNNGFTDVITRNAEGDYTLNYDGAFTVDPVVLGSVVDNNNGDWVFHQETVGDYKTQCRIHITKNGNLDDSTLVHILVVGK